DDIPVLDLPYDYARPKEQSHIGKTIHSSLPNKIQKRLVNLSEKTGTTDYMILLSTFMVLLHKYSQQNDIVVGTPVSGRTHQDTEGVIGMFVNTLAMRLQPDSNKSFIELLSEAKSTALNAYDNQDYPFEELVEKVVKTRDLNRNPLFDVLFTLQNNDQVSLNIGDWETELIETDSEEAKFDLS
ncbi:condensation domain-containing protein, partial [Staphylococcus warneri]|uniref:condensation domain-containing protein n=1 Tax=Staphylococcus warneri TaxID=1292 RepID=UPI001ACFB005